MIKWIANKIIQLCEKYGRYYHILGRPDDATDIYLIRYFVFRSRFFNIYLHRFLRSDADDLHDHPWYFWTMMIQGAYNEISPQGITLRTIKGNKYKFMAPTHLHSVKVLKDRTYEERDKAPLTLCITGPIQREWGFVQLVKNQYEWIPWHKYLNKPEDERPYE